MSKGFPLVHTYNITCGNTLSNLLPKNNFFHIWVVDIFVNFQRKNRGFSTFVNDISFKNMIDSSPMKFYPKEEFVCYHIRPDICKIEIFFFFYDFTYIICNSKTLILYNIYQIKYLFQRMWLRNFARTWSRNNFIHEARCQIIRYLSSFKKATILTTSHFILSYDMDPITNCVQPNMHSKPSICKLHVKWTPHHHGILIFQTNGDHFGPSSL